jgi:magnesium transporter
MQKIEKNQISWFNFLNPGTEDLLFLKDKFGLTSSVLKELPASIKRPKIEEYADYLFLVLHFPVFNEKTRQTIPTELDFIIARSGIATIYQDRIPILESFFDDCSNHPSGRGEYFQNTGYLLFCILDKLIDSCLPMLDHIHDNIEEIETRIFKGQEKEMLSEIAIVKRDIIDFRRTIKPQRSVLEILAEKSGRFLGNNLYFISQEVVGSNTRVWNTLENHKEMIEAIEETNNSLLSHKLNNILKILTIVSFVAFPLNLISGFLGMSVFDNVPFAHSPSTYLTILGADISIILVLILWFKKKRWL